MCKFKLHWRGQKRLIMSEYPTSPDHRARGASADVPLLAGNLRRGNAAARRSL